MVYVDAGEMKSPGLYFTEDVAVSSSAAYIT